MSISGNNPSHKRHRSSSGPKERTPSVYQEEIFTDTIQRVRFTDILPLVLCAGILVLLYFMIKEYNAERKNIETHIASIANRLESIEKSSHRKTDPPPPTKDKDVGTYELKDSIVSFNPVNEILNKDEKTPESNSEDSVTEEDGNDGHDSHDSHDGDVDGGDEESEDGEFS